MFDLFTFHIEVTDGKNSVILERHCQDKKQIPYIIEQEEKTFYNFYPEFDRTKTKFRV